jgi:hypothetical protein
MDEKLKFDGIWCKKVQNIIFGKVFAKG